MGKMRIGDSCIGGIVGFGWTKNVNMAITNCYNTGYIRASYRVAGGIIGCHTKDSGIGRVEIINCYNTRNVSAPEYVGKMAGSMKNVNFENSYVLSEPIIGYADSFNVDSESKIVTSSELKGMAGTLGSAYKNDTGKNGGYPILEWQ